MRKLLILIIVVCSITSNFLFTQDRGVQVVSKEERIALVIGNDNYSKGKLANAVNDAKSMKNTLKVLGFSVIYMENVGLRKMIIGIQDLEKKLLSGGVGLFYFSGHGFQIDGLNFLIPIGANVESEADVKFECFPVDRVLESMSNADNRLNILILDACRDNPFARSFTRSINRGLAQMNGAKGMLIAYATSPGYTASDGPGMSNGLFTYHLLKCMKKPGLSIEQVFKKTREAVNTASKGKQLPWTSSSIIGDFIFSQVKYNAQSTAQVYKPNLPSINKVDLSDIEEEARKNRLRKKREKERKVWLDWQKNFETAVDKANEIEKDGNVSKSSKKKAWERILNAFEQENPYSEEDESLREYINKRILYWKTQMGIHSDSLAISNPPGIFDIVSEVSGTISNLNVKEGDIVYKGDKLIIISNNALKNEINSLEAELEKWISLLKGRQNWKVRSPKAEAQAEREIKKLNISLYKKRRERTKFIIKSPVKGRIGIIKIKIGSSVRENMILMELIPID